MMRKQIKDVSGLFTGTFMLLVIGGVLSLLVLPTIPSRTRRVTRCILACMLVPTGYIAFAGYVLSQDDLFNLSFGDMICMQAMFSAPVTLILLVLFWPQRERRP